ncbi:MAG: hypothetical protein LKK54_03400 [Ancrocorticia sp.]|nr:hypothetical protein [Ancrocorticia sp.]MCI2002297.1 hypothetical protein [Ancrocorticia sp.]MCI2177614.1 hypothetical protein [Ancrocorticia sp.]MCI2198770.1 hypothetical protein [Ancrocorticia sp.]
MKRRAKYLIRFSALFVLIGVTTAILALIGTGAVTRGGGEATTEPSAADTPTVVILTSGLTWTTFDPLMTPALTDIASRGTTANMVPLTPRGGSCPVDSWLAMSAGKQASDSTLAAGLVCSRVHPTAGATLPWWWLYRQNATESFGAFAAALSSAGVTSHAIGSGAAYVLSDANGRAPSSYIEAPETPSALAAAVTQSAKTATLTVVDADAAQIAEQVIPIGESDGEDSLIETNEAAALTLSKINAVRADAVVAALPAGTRVLVVSLLDGDGTNSMQLVISGQVGEETHGAAGLGYSDSVRQDGVIQFADVAPTILAWLGVDTPSTFAGTALQTLQDSQTVQFTERLSELASQASHSGYMRASRGSFLRILTWSAIVYFIASLVMLSQPLYRKTLGHGSAARVWAWAGLTIAAVPVSSLAVNLLPWWRAPSPSLALTGGSWALAAVLGVALTILGTPPRAARGPSASRYAIAPLVLLSAVTALVLAVDATTGSRAMADSPVGFNLLTAARFYGVGNEAYALLATGSLIALSFLGTQLKGRFGITLTAVLGLVVAAIDALPRWGSDFGGALSYLPGLIVLLFLLANVRISWKKIIGIGLLTVCAAGALAIADWMRPAATRTHLGQFVQSIIDGDVWDILGRKLSTNLRLLTTSTHRWVVLAALLLFFLALIHMLRRRTAVDATGHPCVVPQNSPGRTSVRSAYISLWGWLGPWKDDGAAPLRIREPALVPGLTAAAVCIVLAFALNDSGIVLPGMASILAMPPLVHIALCEARWKAPRFAVGRPRPEAAALAD